jgi:hypothetical protein
VTRPAYLAGWPWWLAACLIATAPLMSLRENATAWTLLGMAVALREVRRGRA